MVKNLKKLLLQCCLIVICVFSSSIQAADDVVLTIDKYYSPYMGANLMQAGLTGYSALDDIVASSTEGNRSNCMTAIRFGKWLFLDVGISNFATVLQHEIFGHGARAREFKMNDIGYHINLFSGATTYPQAEYNILDVNQKAALSTGGVEATSILAQEIERRWMISNVMDRRDATLFLINSLDQSVYAFSTSSDAFHPDNDANAYINNVNAWYGKQVLTSHKLKIKTLWNWLDPMLYMSACSIIQYIWEGQPNIQIPTLHIGKSRFLPTTRTLYAPWGPEFQLQAHLYNQQQQYVGVFLRYGKTNSKNSYGADLIVSPMAKYDCWYVANKLSVWHQPHLLKNDTAATNTSKYGFAEFISFYYRLNNGVYANGEIGYKVSGYLPGTPLASGVVWRVGFLFNLP